MARIIKTSLVSILALVISFTLFSQIPVGSSLGGGGTSSGSGTTNTLAKFSGSSSLGNSSVSDNGTAVTITNGGATNLFVNQSTNASAQVSLGANNGAKNGFLAEDITGNLVLSNHGQGGGTFLDLSTNGLTIRDESFATVMSVSLLSALNLGSSGHQGSIILGGATSGTNTVSAPAVAGTGTTFTLPNASGTPLVPINVQYLGTPVTGNSSAQAFQSYTVPANTISANGCIQFQSISKHTTGTASVAYTFSVGGISQSAGAATTANGVNNFIFDLCNTGSTAAGTQLIYTELLVAGGTNSNLLALTSQSVASTGTIAVTVSMNVANTDVVTPLLFKAVLFQ